MNQKGLAIVTGASRGIGAAVATGLAEDGYRPVLIARNKEKLDQVREEIMRAGNNPVEPVVLPADISDLEKTEAAITEVHKSQGPVDILVNSAAIWLEGSLDQPLEKFKKIVDVNLVAQYAILKTVVETMKERKEGYIFNIASRSGKHGFPGGGTYGSTKFALVGLTESLCRELAPHNIRLTSICPGWVNTRMAEEAGTPLSAEEMIQPRDILRTIRYLLSLSESVCIKEIVIEMKKSMV